MRKLGAAVVAILCVACGAPGREGGPDGGGGGDGGGGTDGGSNMPPSVTAVYAHSASTLYRVDPDTLAVTMIAPFGWPSGSDEMTDIAIDKAGVMIGVSRTTVYRVDVTTAQATRLSGGLTGGFNGLSFIPADQIGQTGDDILVGTRNLDGKVFRIDPMTGQASEIGDMNGFASSGDLVAVAMFGTVQTADNLFAADRLIRLAPSTFAGTQIGTDIGFAEIWGVAFWKDKIFGFTSGGQFITIDPMTGAGTLVQSNGPAWWGAAVTTTAPVIL